VAWLRQELTGIYVRRAWFLYEALTGKLLDADDVARTGYINILDPKLHVTGPVRRVRRQRVNHNLLGDNTYCPLIRRTDALDHAMASGLVPKSGLRLNENLPVRRLRRQGFA
jgi:hypothetical protein